MEPIEAIHAFDGPSVSCHSGFANATWVNDSSLLSLGDGCCLLFYTLLSVSCQVTSADNFFTLSACSWYGFATALQVTYKVCLTSRQQSAFGAVSLFSVQLMHLAHVILHSQVIFEDLVAHRAVVRSRVNLVSSRVLSFRLFLFPVLHVLYSFAHHWSPRSSVHDHLFHVIWFHSCVLQTFPPVLDSYLSFSFSLSGLVRWPAQRNLFRHPVVFHSEDMSNSL